MFGGVLIGDRVTLSREVMILTVGLDTSNYIENANKQYRDHIVSSVEIEEGVWLGAKVLVLPGAHIAKNSIVAAGAVVVGDLSTEGCLYGGIPAKYIKNL